MTRKPQRASALQRQSVRVNHQLTALARTSSRLAEIRLIVFVAAIGIGAAAWAFGGWVTGSAATLIGLLVFTIAARHHRRIKRALDQHTLWRQIKVEHLARMRLEWDLLPPARITTPRRDHPLERDLDLVGNHSLHHLIDTTIARESSLRLRDWLAASVPDPEVTQQRQALIIELVPRVIFRDKLHLYGALDPARRSRQWSGSRLVDWVTAQPPTNDLTSWLMILSALAVSNVILFGLNTLGILPPLWQLTALLYAGIYLWHAWRLGDLFGKAQALSDPLRELKAIFTHLEKTHYVSGSALRDLCTPFVNPQRRPSAELARLTRVLSLASFRGNPWLWMALSALMPWDLLVAQALDRRRVALAELLPQWLDTWYELEALSALATLAYLNPDYTFPKLIESPQHNGPILTAEALGHPLIPDERRICNSINFEHLGNLTMITGSNMSGKSTFLRTLGINLCLAYAGGPVVAQTLSAVPLRLYSCIRVSDSVTDGISYFYAEVKCLKGLLEALQTDHAYPVFYLIDEIFRGTNNRERLLGSRAYIRAMAGQRGAGALSTHDLELVHLAEDMPTIRNYHFTESIDERRLLFDYRLRPGPCPSTNALKIMALEGLPVPIESAAQPLGHVS